MDGNEMKRWISASTIVAITGLTVLFIVTAPTDEQLIRSAIDESVQASREGKPNPVLDNLTRTFTWNGQTVGLNRSEVSRYVRLGRPEIDLAPYRPEINDDKATVVTDAHIKIEFQSLKFDQTVPGLEIKRKRETGTRWLVFPSARWKIYEVTAPDLASIPNLGY